MIKMKRKHKKRIHSALYYAPRVLALLIGLFFLLMLFDLPYGFTLCELLRALLPGMIIILAILLTWNKPRRASLVFLILSLVYTMIRFAYLEEHVVGVVTLPLIIVSALFFFNTKSEFVL